MWRKQDEPQAASLPAQTKSTPVTMGPQTPPFDQSKSAGSPLSSPASCLTRLLTVKGEITGEDDLVIDGEVHGKIHLRGKLNIGPEGRVTAEIEAAEVVVRGEARGSIKGHQRVHIAASGKATGEVSTPLISIEEGAAVHGLCVNVAREERPRPAGSMEADSRRESKAAVPLPEKASQVHV